MNLNKMIPKVGSAIVTVTVFLFALFLIINYSMGSFFVCLILPIGFIMMSAGLHNEIESDRKVGANIGLILAGVYSTFIMLVYFTQLTTVNNEQLTEQAANLLEMGKCGLIFNFDLLGYGVMALSTFFTGLSMKAKNKNRQVAQSIYDDTWSILLQLYVYADNGNVLKDVVWRQRPRRKACSCCMVCVFSSCRDTIFSSFQKDEIRA